MSFMDWNTGKTGVIAVDYAKSSFPEKRDLKKRVWTSFNYNCNQGRNLVCARFSEFVQNFSERQILWSLC